VAHEERDVDAKEEGRGHARVSRGAGDMLVMRIVIGVVNAADADAGTDASEDEYAEVVAGYLVPCAWATDYCGLVRPRKVVQQKDAHIEDSL
jgi:hypothetical protein